MKINSINPDLHKYFILMRIDHEFAIISIFTWILHGIEKSNLASFGALNGDSHPSFCNLSMADGDQFAVFGRTVIALPIERGRA